MTHLSKAFANSKIMLRIENIIQNFILVNIILKLTDLNLCWVDLEVKLGEVNNPLL